MKKIVISFLILVILPSIVFSEENGQKPGPVEPDNTDIILPEMYLEIEDLSVEEIEAIIPDDDSVVFMAIEMQLPKPGEIKLPPEVFALPSSDIPIEDFPVTNTSLYCEGMIGAGTSSNITGDINLYHIGNQPNFRLRYFHNGYDGFAGKKAGMGFLKREELIEAEIGFDKEFFDVDALVTFNELEDGLQGLSDYYSATRRNIALESGLNYTINNNFVFTGDIETEYSGYRLNSEQLSPLAYDLFMVKPNVDISFNYKSIKTSLELEYLLDTELDERTDQALSTNLLFYADIFNYLKIDSKVGLMWEDFTSLHIPFFVNLSGTGSLIDYFVKGGRRFSFIDWPEFWKTYPASAGPLNAEIFADVPLFNEWYAEGEIKVNLSEFLTLSGEFDFSYSENAPKPDGISELKGFSTVAAEDDICFDAGAGVYWSVNKIFALDFSWHGQMLEDLNWFTPRHSFDLVMNLDDENDKMGISMKTNFEIYDEEQIWFKNSFVPKLGFEGYFSIYDGFMLSFTFSDVLANLIDEGRILYNGYYDVGTVFQGLVKISL